MARVSNNTQSSRLSVQWIDAAKAVHFHVSLNTLRPQVFLGLPFLLALGIIILVMEFMHACPNHLKRLVRRAAVTSCTPNIAQSVSADTSSSSLTPQIQRTIDLSLWRSCCKPGAVGGQVSLPCNRAECTQALKTFSWVLRCQNRKKPFKLSPGSTTSGDNGKLASSTGTQHVSKVAKVEFHVE